MAKWYKDGLQIVIDKIMEQINNQFNLVINDEDGSLFKAYEGENNIFPTSYIITLTELQMIIMKHCEHLYQ